LPNKLSALYLAGLSDDYSARKSGERWKDATEPDELARELDAVLGDIKTAVVTGDVTPFEPTVTQLALWRGYGCLPPPGFKDAMPWEATKTGGGHLHTH